MIRVAGADAVLDTFLAARHDASPGVAAARALLQGDVAWEEIRDDIVASERAIVLAAVDDGPILAAKAFRSGVPTDIHDHRAAGAALSVEGRSRYERFTSTGPGEAELDSTHELLPGDVVWWNDPPDDVHRQVAVSDLSIELVLLARPPQENRAFADASPPLSELGGAARRAFLEGDIASLQRLYAPDVLVDLHVPQWRFQLRGRSALFELLEKEELRKPDRRLAALRMTDTAAGLIVETEGRHTDHGELCRFHEIHHLRCAGDVVVEHRVWCTGIADARGVAEQQLTAPMERM